MCSSLLHKVKLVDHEIGYLAKEISKKSIESVVWIFLTAYNKMWKKKHELNKEFLSKMEWELEYLENAQSILQKC